MALQRCVFCYLLNIILNIIIKANAIIVTAIKAVNSKIINCNNIFSIICTTSILCKVATTFCFSKFSLLII